MGRRRTVESSYNRLIKRNQSVKHCSRMCAFIALGFSSHKLRTAVWEQIQCYVDTFKTHHHRSCNPDHLQICLFIFERLGCCKSLNPFENHLHDLLKMFHRSLVAFLVEKAEHSLDYHFKSFHRCTEKVAVELVFFHDVENRLQ